MAAYGISRHRLVDVLGPLAVLRGDEGKLATIGLSRCTLPI